MTKGFVHSWVSGVTHLRDQGDLLPSLLLVIPGHKAEQCPPCPEENFPDRGKLCHETDFIPLGLVRPCVAEQGMWWETRNLPGLLRTSCSWLSEMSLWLPLVRLRHKAVLESSGV